MDNLIKILVLVLGIAVIGAGAYMCIEQKEGWGWFLFVGFVLAGNSAIINNGCDCNCEEKEE